MDDWIRAAVRNAVLAGYERPSPDLAQRVLTTLATEEQEAAARRVGTRGQRHRLLNYLFRPVVRARQIYAQTVVQLVEAMRFRGGPPTHPE